jgi:type II secretory pathway component GspD/PulD (secretin)
LLQAAQEDARANVLQAPKVTLFNGQRSVLCIGEERSFVTGVDVRPQDGQAVLIPKTETLLSGIDLSVQAVIAADRRSVRLDLQARMQDVDPEVPLIPVTVPVPAVGGDGDKEAKPVAFTQFLQQPRVQKLTVEKTFSVPDGHTMVLDGGTRIREGRTEYGPPILSSIPYLSRLFRNVGYSRSEERVLVLVTPRIIRNEEEEERAKPAAPDTKGLVGEVLKHFTKAFKEGKYDESEKWALMAEEMDPDNGVCSAALLIARREKASHARQPAVPCAEEESSDTPCPAAKCVRERVAELLAKYREALVRGRLEEAHDLARKALDIDPACFARPRR